MSDFVLLGTGAAVALGLVTLISIFGEVLSRFLDIQVTSWVLRRQGVKRAEIHKIVLTKARRDRQPVVVQLMALAVKLKK